jgi:lysophospholipase L1-like esterase
LKDGDVVAIVGDSITEGRQYSAFVEDYLLMCQPAKVRAMQFGWSGETVNGLNARVAEVLNLKPTVVTLCYGMNDGRYVPVTDEIKGAYRAGLLKAVQTLQQAGAAVVVGSPGCVDTDFFARPTATPDQYNNTLSALKDESAGVARQTGSTFADVFTPMHNAMAPAKQRYGRDYSIAGGDGFHPRANGGLVMAYAFLKGLGFDGNVGTLYIDLAERSAKTFGNHRFVKAEANAYTFESSAYPFCFTGDPKDTGATTGLLDFVPFNADLNRFTLTATGPAPKYRVTWGKASKDFTAEQLKAGVNLAAEFLDNPFVAPFMAVHAKVMQKQVDEVLLLKQLLHSLNASRDFMPDHGDELNAVVRAIPAAHTKLADGVARSVVPVTHTLTLEPIH